MNRDESLGGQLIGGATEHRQREKRTRGAEELAAVHGSVQHVHGEDSD
jgi:hypothetical protein